jgi:outer membrane protein OmpA-like peptidoglycan-associated protein
MKKLWLTVLLPAFAVATSAHAGGVRMYGTGEVPAANEIADILGAGSETGRPKMRGISLDPVKMPHEQMGVDVANLSTPKETVVGLPITFGFNSAEILPENEAQLDAVAEGIKLTQGITVVVEGHTDAFGPDAYNDQLSQQRAQAVRDYLVDRHGIEPTRFVIEGFGSRSPIDGTDPFAAENRRVQLRAAK